jgi:hypothetical protein
MDCLLFGHHVKKEIDFFFQLNFFRQVNYIFHKLSSSTKHIEFQFHMSPWWIFVQNGLYINFSCNFGGAHVSRHVAEIAQGLKIRVPKKKLVLLIESWVFIF